MEKWKGLGRYLTCIILLGGIFCLFGVRLVDWQIISGEELLEAVSTLEEPDRQILIRRYEYGQKPREIALALGLSVKQVNNRLYRAKRKLRDLLTHCKEAYP